MSFSVVPLLITGKSISPEARQALRENRMQDAAAILMEQYGLNCSEAGQLLDLSLCKEDNAIDRTFRRGQGEAGSRRIGEAKELPRAELEYLRKDPNDKAKARSHRS